MPPPAQLPAPSPAPAVMTFGWTHGSRHQTPCDSHPRINLQRSSPASDGPVVTPLIWTSALFSASFSHPSWSSLHLFTLPRPCFSLTGRRIHTFCQVRELVVILLLILVTCLPRVTLALPWSQEQPDHVIFRSQICQPLSPSHLRMMMGSNYDENKMASDQHAADNLLASANRAKEDDYQSDDPEVDQVRNADSIGDKWIEYEDADMGGKTEMAKDSGEGAGSRTWLPRKRVLNRRTEDSRTQSRSEESWDNLNEVSSSDDITRQTLSTQHPPHRIRPRRSAGKLPSGKFTPHSRLDTVEARSRYTREAVQNEDEPAPSEPENSLEPGDKKPKNSLQLQLFYSGNDKKKRKKLKKQLRQQPINLSKPPPWECKFSQRQTQMSRGVFPEWILEGRCESKHCFYRLYNCEPIKYTLKLLQRDPTQCNPLPSLSNSTVYEERWQLVQKYVIVGCTCASPNLKNAQVRKLGLFAGV